MHLIKVGQTFLNFDLVRYVEYPLDRKGRPKGKLIVHFDEYFHKTFSGEAAQVLLNYFESVKLRDFPADSVTARHSKAV